MILTKLVRRESAVSKYLRSKHGTQPQVVGIVDVSAEKENLGRALTVAEPLPIRGTRRGHWSLRFPDEEAIDSWA